MSEHSPLRPHEANAFEFTIISALRAKQLLRGSTPRLPGDHCATTMARMEVAAGYIARNDSTTAEGPRQCGWQR